MERRIFFIVTFRKHDLGIVRTRRIYPRKSAARLDCIRSKWICSKCTKLHLGNETRRHLRTVQNEEKERGEGARNRFSPYYTLYI